MGNKWHQAKRHLAKLIEDLSRLSVDSLSEKDHLDRKDVPSPISGFHFEIETSLLLNGTWTVSVEAERRYFFGLFYRSLYKIVHIQPEEAVVPAKFHSRLELFHTRSARRGCMHVHET